MNRNRIQFFLILLLVASIAAIFSCSDDSLPIPVPIPGDDDDDDDNGPIISNVSLTLDVGAAIGEPKAGDTLVAIGTIVNTGEAPTKDLEVIYHYPECFDFLTSTVRYDRSEKISDSLVTIPLPLDPADTATIELKLLIPKHYPDGWQAEVSLLATVDHDLADSTDPIAVTQSAAAEIRNDGLDFTVYGPGVPEIFLAGEFNGWLDSTPRDPDYLLFEDEESGQWGITVNASGRQQYKFQLYAAPFSKPEWIGDPRATLLEPDGFDGYNSVGGVPLPDPVAPLSGGIDKSKLVIYELFTWDFSPAGDFQSVIDGITGGDPDLVDLGINAIELLPVTGVRPERAGDSPGQTEDRFNWGYTPNFYFAVENDYGSLQDFADLVETAHQNGIAVILDMVLNHTSGGGSPMWVLDAWGTPGSWINHDQSNQFGLPEMNWESEEIRQFMLDVCLFWIEQYGIDGYRLDFVKPEEYTAYAWLRNEIKSRHPDFLLIGEDFNYPPNSCINLSGFDAQWGGQHTDQWGGVANNFMQIVQALLKEGQYFGRGSFPYGSFETEDNPMWALANVLSQNDAFGSPHNEIRYIVSHDEHRMVWEVDNLGSPEAQAIGGIRKSKLGAATLFTSVGIPMIYMGDEIGEDDFVPQHPTPNKIDWASGDQELRTYFKELISLRLGRPDLASTGISFFGPDWGVSEGSYQQNKTIQYWRYSGANEQNAGVVVASNFDHDDHDLVVQFPSSGSWLRFGPDDGYTGLVIDGSKALALTIPASTAYIFTRIDTR